VLTIQKKEQQKYLTRAVPLPAGYDIKQVGGWDLSWIIGVTWIRYHEVTLDLYVGERNTLTETGSVALDSIIMSNSGSKRQRRR